MSVYAFVSTDSFYCQDGAPFAVLERVETTRVRFAQLGDAAIARYVATGEPMDKAGAYAMQDIGGIFVERIEGSPSNVIGLPLATVAALLAAAGLVQGE